MKINEITRRGFLKGVGGAATLASAPAQAVKSVASTAASIAASPKPTKFIWSIVGDSVDREHITKTVASLVKLYEKYGKLKLSPEEIKSRIDKILRHHRFGFTSSKPGKTYNDEWDKIRSSFDEFLPFPQIPEEPKEWDYETDAEYIDAVNNYDNISYINEPYHRNLSHLIKVTGDAVRGDTKDYGYQVNHRIKTGEIKPVDYSKPTSSIATQAANTVATQTARAPIATAASAGVSALKDLGRRAKNYLAKKAMSTSVKPEAPKALSAPTNDNELMRDLNKKITEPTKERVKTK